MGKTSSAKVLFKGKDGQWRKNVTINGENLTLRVNQKSETEESEEPKNEE